MKFIKFILLKIKRNLLKVKRNLMRKYGEDIFFKISENYFASIFMLIIIKLIFRLLQLHISIKLNYLLLFSFFFINMQFNTIIIIKNNFKTFLNNYLPTLIINDNIQDYGPYTQEQFEKEYLNKEYRHKLVIYLIYLRLLIDQEKYLFMFINFFILQLFLFNKFLIIASFYQFIVIISKLTLYINDYNQTILKINLLNYDEKLNDNEIRLKATKNNSILLSYWICRDLTRYSEYRKPYENYHFQFLEIKYDEKHIYGVNHKYFNRPIEFDKYKFKFKIDFQLTKKINVNSNITKRFFSSAKTSNISYIFFKDIGKLKKNGLVNQQNWNKLKQLEHMEKHPVIAKINFETNIVDFCIGTTKYLQTPNRRIYNSDKIASNTTIPNKSSNVAVQACNSEGVSVVLTPEMQEYLEQQNLLDKNDLEVINLRKSFYDTNYFEKIQNDGLGFIDFEKLSVMTKKEIDQANKIYIENIYSKNHPNEDRLINTDFSHYISLPRKYSNTKQIPKESEKVKNLKIQYETIKKFYSDLDFAKNKNPSILGSEMNENLNKRFKFFNDNDNEK